MLFVHVVPNGGISNDVIMRSKSFGETSKWRTKSQDFLSNGAAVLLQPPALLFDWLVKCIVEHEEIHSSSLTVTKCVPQHEHEVGVKGSFQSSFKSEVGVKCSFQSSFKLEVGMKYSFQSSFKPEFLQVHGHWLPSLQGTSSNPMNCNASILQQQEFRFHRLPSPTTHTTRHLPVATDSPRRSLRNRRPPSHPVPRSNASSKQENSSKPNPQPPPATSTNPILPASKRSAKSRAKSFCKSIRYFYPKPSRKRKLHRMFNKSQTLETLNCVTQPLQCLKC